VLCCGLLTFQFFLDGTLPKDVVMEPRTGLEFYLPAEAVAPFADGLAKIPADQFFITAHSHAGEVVRLQGMEELWSHIAAFCEVIRTWPKEDSGAFSPPAAPSSA
jgi:hypothetical protein